TRRAAEHAPADQTTPGARRALLIQAGPGMRPDINPDAVKRLLVEAERAQRIAGAAAEKIILLGNRRHPQTLDPHTGRGLEERADQVALMPATHDQQPLHPRLAAGQPGLLPPLPQVIAHHLGVGVLIVLDRVVEDAQMPALAGDRTPGPSRVHP